MCREETIFIPLISDVEIRTFTVFQTCHLIESPAELVEEIEEKEYIYIYIYIINIFIYKHTHTHTHTHTGFPGGSVVKNLPVNIRDVNSIPWLGRSQGQEMSLLFSR